MWTQYRYQRLITGGQFEASQDDRAKVTIVLHYLLAAYAWNWWEMSRQSYYIFQFVQLS